MPSTLRVELGTSSRLPCCWLDGVDVAVGDLVALAIREGDGHGQRVTLYEKSSWHGEQATSASCHELIWSFPPNLDGGFFGPVKGGE